MNSGQPSNRIQLFSVIRLFVISIIVLRPLVPNPAVLGANANGPLAALLNPLAPQTARAAATGPGGVGTGLRTWVKADVGISVTVQNAQVTSWIDQSGLGNNFSNSDPNYEPYYQTAANTNFNFNPVVKFTNSDVLFAAQQNLGTGTTAKFDAFFVASSNNNNARYSGIGLVGTNQGAGGVSYNTYSGNNFYVSSNIGVNNEAIAVKTFVPNQPALVFGRYSGPGFGASLDGEPLQTNTTSVNVGATYMRIGEGGYNGDFWNGSIAEAIYYNANLSASDHSKVQSYLAAKYAITLDQSTPQSYLASNGTTKMWDHTATSASTYNADIAVIGRDDGSDLLQKQSRSASDSLGLAIGAGNQIAATNTANAATLSDLSFTAWGHNNLATTIATNVGTVGGATVTRMARIWNVQETGTDTGVLKFNVAQPAFGAKPNPVLIISNDATFDSTDSVVSMNCAKSICSASANLANGQFFSLGSKTLNPADFDNDGISNANECVAPEIVYAKAGVGTQVWKPDTANPGTFLATPATTNLGAAFDIGDQVDEATFIGDTNSDGLGDIIWAVEGLDKVQVYLGQSDGTYSATPVIGTMDGSNAFYVGIASAQMTLLNDVTGDGILDLVTGTDGQDNLRVWPGLGNAHFRPGLTLSYIPNLQSGVSTAEDTFLIDVTGDGRPDWVNLQQGTGVQVWPGLPEGRFDPTPINTTMPGTWNIGSDASEATQMGDVTGDGVPDIVWSDSTSHSLVVTVGNGDGTFGTSFITTVMGASFDTGNSTVEATFLTDQTKDGIPDVVWAANAGTVKEIRTYVGLGDGHFDTSYLSSGASASNGFGGDFSQSTKLNNTLADSDGDGIPNCQDADDDNDKVPTLTEGASTDIDGDGIPNYRDVDDDGDGIPTALEDTNGDGDLTNDDVNNNGIPAYLDATEQGGTDSDSDTVPNSMECRAPTLAFGTGLNTGSITAWVARGDGSLVYNSSTITSPVTTNFSADFDAGDGPGEETFLTDVTGDGIPDWVYTQSNIRVRVFRGLGNDRFDTNVILTTMPSTFQAGADYNRSTEMKDVTGDGLVDIVFGDENTAVINVWRNVGGGRFATSSINTSFPTGLYAGNNAEEQTFLADVTGDGIFDWIWAAHSPSTGWIRVWPGLSGANRGKFNTTYIGNDLSGVLALWDIGVSAGESTFMGDVNGDNKLDIVYGVEQNRIDVWLGNGDGTFQQTNIRTLMNGYFDAGGNSSQETLLADFNQDGNLDWIFSSAVGTIGTKVWFGNGDGTFQTSFVESKPTGFQSGTDATKSTEIDDTAIDSDGDGMPNCFDADDDGDKVLTSIEGTRNTDGDTLANYLDPDDDNDGIRTIFEDLNGDGNYQNDDTDGDGIPNYLDADDDGDTIPTALEQADPNGDGDPADAVDSNANGIKMYLDINEGPATDVTISKAASAISTTTSSIVVYTLTVANTSAMTATNVVVTDALPSGLTGLSASNTYTTANPTLTAGQTVSWSLGHLGVTTTQRIVITATTPSAIGNITNTAGVSATNDTTNNNYASVGVQIVLAPGADLTVTLGQPAPNLVAGLVSTMPVTVGNALTANVTPGAITTTLTLPANVSAPASFSSGGNTCTTAAQTVTCVNPGPIAPGSSNTLQVPVTPATATIGTQPMFTATVANFNELVTANNTATLTAAVAVGFIPAAPVITAPTNGSTISTSTPSISGTGLAGAVLTVTTSPTGTTVCSTTVAAAGTWSCTPSAALPQGSNSVVAVQSNASGLSPASPVDAFNIDSVAPAIPVIVAPAATSTLSATTPTISGTAEAGSTVVVKEGATTLCTATANASGDWSCTPASAMAAGVHSITATATDAAGNTSAISTARSFNIDNTAPAAPVITAPANGSVLSSTTPTISGTAEAGSTVVVNEGAATLCTATANASGVWSCAPSSALASGAHSVTATATDAVGNIGPASTAASFTIDTTAPAAPAITSPAASSVLSGTPTISGTAEANSTVVVKEGATTVCTATANASGAWSCTPASALAAGAHSITATATDGAGNTGVASAATSFTIDNTAPAAPVISAPAASSVLSDTTPTFSGTAEANSTVVVKEGTTTVCTATADATGNWTCDATAALSSGAHSVTATASDALGNVGPASPARSFSIDSAAPAAPSISQPAASSVLSDTTPNFGGTAEAGSTVVVKEGTTTLCTTTADASGNWVCAPTTAMSAGAHSVTATATDAVGNTSAASAARAFTVDNTAPAAPVISNPAAASTTSDSTPTFNGTAEAGSTVTVLEGTTPVCTATTDASGNWTCDATAALSNGAHSVTATATDAGGNVSTAAARSFTVSNASSSITSPATGAVLSDTTPTFNGTGVPGAAVTVGTSPTGTTICTTTVDAAGNWTCTPTTAMAQGTTAVTATLTNPGGSVTTPAITMTVDSIAPSTPTVSTPAANSATNDNTPTLSGSAEPGSSVKVTENGVTLCTATADASGNWSCTPSVSMAEGAHTVSVSATDAAGNSSAASTRLFTVDTLAPVAPTVSSPTANSVTPSTQPSISGSAEAGSTVTVKEGTTTVCTATADASGNWTCTPTTALSEGAHSLSVTQTDTAGNTSSATTRSFTVDSTAPAAPAISAPAQNAVVTTTQPSIAGTSEAGAVISVTEGTSTVCTTTADAGGNWSCTPTVALSQGAHTITAQAIDAAGSASSSSASRTFTVDTVAPNAPVVAAPVTNTTTSDNTPTVSGSAEPGSTVKVSENGSPVCTAVADASGNWTCEVPSAMSNGAHTLQVVATDPAGNTSSATSRTFTVSNTTPSISGPTTGSVLSDTTPTFTGTGTPGAPVTVTTSPTGTVLCATTADASGNWTCTPTTAMPEGKTTVVAQIGDPSGTLTTTPVTFGVDATAPVAPTVTSPAGSGKTNDSTPQISGTAEPSSTVKVTENGVTLCTAVADANGNWSCSPALPMADGSHTLSVTTTDLGGNVSTATTRTFGVDSVAPTAPTATSPTNGSAISDTTPTFSGTGEAGGTVTVTTSPTGTVLCTATVDASGNWNCTPTTALGEGSNTVSIGQTDAAGNDSPAITRTFTVDTVAPMSPTVGSPTNGSIISDTTPTFSGTGEPGAAVTVTTSPTGTVLCTATVDASGNWTCTPTTALSGGSNTVSVTQTDAAGNASPSVTRTFTVDAAIPSTPTVGAPPNGSVISDTTPTFSGTGDAGDVITVTTSPTGTAVCSATVDASGNWSCTPTTALPEGSNTVSVTQTSAAGIPSAPLTRTFTVDTVAPTAPTVGSPTNGSVISDTTPTFTGTGEPGGVVTVTTSPTGTVLCTATVDASGNWSCTPTTVLPEGSNAVSVTQTDAAGNVSTPTTRTFTIATIPSVDGDGDGVPDSEECPTGTPCRDSDGDGIPDNLDPDDDNDGILTMCPATGANQECKADVDGDGIPAYLDPNDSLDLSNGGDSDGDGIPDAIECGAVTPCLDSDGDGIPDYRDTDGDNDGVSDKVECANGLPCTDTDGDGKPDYRDLDDDGDGLVTKCPTAGSGQECSADQDNDGIPAYLDSNDSQKQPNGGDSDGDGIPDVVECARGVPCADTDGDGIPDYRDTDSDGDGVPDKTECTGGSPCTDTDKDGIPDYLEPNNRDSDGDGKTDNVDNDDDNDGIPTQCPTPTVGQECSADADGDGIPAYLDPNDSQQGVNGGDSDGDGIPDKVECPTGMPCPDSDGDGVPDFRDTDGDNDGIPDKTECPKASACPDSDGDGKPDYRDNDDDNEGIVTKCPTTGINQECDADADGDGIPAYVDPNDHQKLPNGGDSDGDGISDKDECPNGAPCPDTDGDGVPDYRDLDSDGDGVSDQAECPTGAPCPDADDDGVPDSLEPNNRDTDGDGIPDYKDNDDDNDGIKTHCPTPGSNQECTADQDGDGIPAFLDPNDHLKQANGGDSDGDGIPDKQECPNGMPCPDSDGDGKPDYLDTDGDNDGVPDSAECSTGLPCRDSDGDGVPDYRDIDDDGDGRITHCPTAGAGQECKADEDGDGVPAYLDANDHLKLAGGGDSDGDGISDSVECGSTVLCADSDRDGIPDYQDRDSDNDGFSDGEECVTGVPCADSDSDGIPTHCPIPGASQECSADADGDGIPAYLDKNDSQKLVGGGDGDGDGVSDSEECPGGAPCRDTDGDGRPDYADTDDDGDGLLTQCPTPGTGKECKGDSDGDGIYDYLDRSAASSQRPTITPINGTPNYTPNGLVQLSGTGTPAATITVKEGDQVVCTTTASSLGLWTCEASLGVGTHTLLATDSNNLSSDPTQIVIVVRDNVIYLPMVKRMVQ